MKTLTILWQRLLNAKDQTCPRCGDTGENVKKAFAKLKRALAELDLNVELNIKALDHSTFTKDPLQSNCIFINGKLIEKWLGGEFGASRCCDACGDANCRTITFAHITFESIPEHLIIKAGLLAAAELL